MTPEVKHRIVAKTANYQIESRRDRSGTIFTNRGDTDGVTFTLPPPGRCQGWEYTFVTVAAQVLTIATKTADTLIAYSEVANDTFATPAEEGVFVRAICDGTSWILEGSTNIPGGTTGSTYVAAG